MKLNEQHYSTGCLEGLTIVFLRITSGLAKTFIVRVNIQFIICVYQTESSYLRFMICLFIRLNIALRMSIWSVQMMGVEWVKPVATGLLVIRLSRPFAAEPVANWVMKK